ncbi:MAG: 3-methyl-2-oxobutanoate hydroxymethyltransferase [Candidatus Azobacteroides sp.]|nr:3-methyl-2-oxobutanoate hydroxymethyltransferase [Candidatus Azobacteroides sp.]
MSTHPEINAAITTQRLIEMKRKGEKISMLTAYDYSMANITDAAGIDVVLVGDSASNVMAGNSTTIPITLDQIIYHAQSVRKAVKKALLCVDLPFGSYQVNADEAVRSAIRIMKETEADAVKLEGGRTIKESVQRIVSAGIPVMGHLGLTPQSVHQFGGYAVRAKETAEAQQLMEDALLLQNSGCFAVVLEKIPAELARKVTAELIIPSIGIGAGPNVDGQVLVLQDMLGINKDFSPKFLRRYAALYDVIKEAVENYVRDVKGGDYPNEKESYG